MLASALFVYVAGRHRLASVDVLRPAEFPAKASSSSRIRERLTRKSCIPIENTGWLQRTCALASMFWCGETARGAGAVIQQVMSCALQVAGLMLAPRRSVHGSTARGPVRRPARAVGWAVMVTACARAG